MANKTYTTTLLYINSGIVWIYVPLAFYVFNNDLHFFSSSFLAQKKEFFQKGTSNESWRMWKIFFWPKPNIRKAIYKKVFNLKSWSLKSPETIWSKTFIGYSKEIKEQDQEPLPFFSVNFLTAMTYFWKGDCLISGRETGN